MFEELFSPREEVTCQELALEVVQDCDYSPPAIVDLFMEVLTQANCHTLVKRIRPICAEYIDQPHAPGP